MIVSESKGGHLRNEVGQLMEAEVEIDARTLACGIPRGTQYKAGRWKQFKTLLWRSWISSIREAAALWVRLIQIAVSINKMTFHIINRNEVLRIFSSLPLY